MSGVVEYRCCKSGGFLFLNFLLFLYIYFFPYDLSWWIMKSLVFGEESRISLYEILSSFHDIQLIEFLLISLTCLPLSCCLKCQLLPISLIFPDSHLASWGESCPRIRLSQWREWASQLMEMVQFLMWRKKMLIFFWLVMLLVNSIISLAWQVLPCGASAYAWNLHSWI